MGIRDPATVAKLTRGPIFLCQLFGFSFKGSPSRTNDSMPSFKKKFCCQECLDAAYARKAERGHFA